MDTITYSAYYIGNDGYPVIIGYSMDITDTTTTDREKAADRARQVARETGKPVVINCCTPALSWTIGIKPDGRVIT